jgi:hypothetical protein
MQTMSFPGFFLGIFIINKCKNISPIYIPYKLYFLGTDDKMFDATLVTQSNNASQVHLEIIAVNFAMTIISLPTDEDKIHPGLVVRD